MARRGIVDIGKSDWTVSDKALSFFLQKENLVLTILENKNIVNLLVKTNLFSKGVSSQLSKMKKSNMRGGMIG